MIRWIFVVAGLLGAAGVAAGAYTAHGFEKSLEKLALPPEEMASRLNQAEIAVRYHLLHAVALLALAAPVASLAPRSRSAAAVLFLIGLACFCGVLYAKAFFALPGFNLVVPFGGLAFILGWLVIAAVPFVVPKRSE